MDLIAPVPVEGKDLDAYFEENKAKKECPMCNSANWNLPIAPELHDPAGALFISPMELMFSETESARAGAIASFALICNVCGFIRLQSFHHFSSWLDARKDRS